MIDWILCLFVAGLIDRPPATGLWADLILIAEYGFFLGLFGQTPGMRVARIRCVSIVHGRAVGIPRALLRGLLLVLIVPALIIGQSGRGLHDRAAGSIVVSS